MKSISTYLESSAKIFLLRASADPGIWKQKQEKIQQRIRILGKGITLDYLSDIFHYFFWITALWMTLILKIQFFKKKLILDSNRKKTKKVHIWMIFIKTEKLTWKLDNFGIFLSHWLGISWHTASTSSWFFHRIPTKIKKWILTSIFYSKIFP